VAIADVRHSCYSVRYSLWRGLGRPSESLVSAGVPTPKSGLRFLQATFADNFPIGRPRELADLVDRVTRA
jgi:hypothetical protein